MKKKDEVKFQLLFICKIKTCVCVCQQICYCYLFGFYRHECCSWSALFVKFSFHLEHKYMYLKVGTFYTLQQCVLQKIQLNEYNASRCDGDDDDDYNIV